MVGSDGDDDDDDDSPTKLGFTHTRMGEAAQTLDFDKTLTVGTVVVEMCNVTYLVFLLCSWSRRR